MASNRRRMRPMASRVDVLGGPSPRLCNSVTQDTKDSSAACIDASSTASVDAPTPDAAASFGGGGLAGPPGCARAAGIQDRGGPRPPRGAALDGVGQS